MLRRIANRFYVSIANEGIGGTFAKVATVAGRVLQRRTPDPFDVAFRTDTAAAVPLWRLKIPSPNAKYGIRYQMSNPSFFSAVIRMVPAATRDFTFVDLGCGKGRVLILAAQEQFRRVIGVEFSPKLAAIARQNLSLVGATAEVVETDASEFIFPDNDLLIYMYNPFGKPVMESVVRNLVAWSAKGGRSAFVIYAFPKHDIAFQSSPEFRSVQKTDVVSVWQLSPPRLIQPSTLSGTD